MVTLCLTSWRITVPYSTEAAPFYFPASSAQEFQCVDIFAKNFFQNFIYLFLFWAVRGLCCCKQVSSGCGEWGPLSSCDVQASYCCGFSCGRARALQHVGFSSLGAQALLPYGMWNLPRPGVEPVSPALADGFLTTGPPEMSIVCVCLFLNNSHPHGYEIVSIVSLTGMSLMIRDAQHLFMYLLAFLVSFYYVFWKYLFARDWKWK